MKAQLIEDHSERTQTTKKITTPAKIRSYVGPNSRKIIHFSWFAEVESVCRVKSLLPGNYSAAESRDFNP